MLGGADAFPGRGDLDQHPLAADAGRFVQADQSLGSLDAGLAVEGQARIHLGGDAPRNDLQDFATNGHGKAIAGQAQILSGTGDGGLQLPGITRQRGSLEQQRGVGGGVHRLQARNGVEVAGVGDHGGVLLELLQLGSHLTKALSLQITRH
ncbi:hypothetical protein D3C80_1352060 [compost metagenome]